MSLVSTALQNPFIFDPFLESNPAPAAASSFPTMDELAAMINRELSSIVAAIDRPRHRRINRDEFPTFEQLILSDQIGAGELMDLFAANPEFDAWYIARVMDRLSGKAVE